MSLISETESAINDTEEQIRLKEIQLGRLQLTATTAGIVIPPPKRTNESQAVHQLPRWSNSPIYPDSLNAWLESGTEFCLVADPNKYEAILVIDESDIELVREGQAALLVLEQFRDTVVSADLTFVSSDELKVVPRELSQTNGGPIAVKPDGSEQSILKSFEAKAPLDIQQLKSKSIEPLTGYYGIAKIRVGNASLGNQALRYLRTLINFR